MRMVYKFAYDGEHRDSLLAYCATAKNLYNQALYLVRDTLRTQGRLMPYREVEEAMKVTMNLEGQVNYRLMPKAQSAQQTLRNLDADMRSYVKAIKAWKRDKSRFSGMPRLPRYKKDYAPLLLTSQCCSVREGFLNVTKEVAIPIPQWEKYGVMLSSFHQARVLPRRGGKRIDIEIVYDAEARNADLVPGRMAAIDLGIGNLVTMVDTEGRPIIFGGGQAKSTNQWLNKRLSELRSIADRCNGRHMTRRMAALFEKRNRRIDDIMHKVSRAIVRHLVDNGIGTLAVGYNKGWKDSVRLGKSNNQAFVSIPHHRLMEMLRYKCALCGISVIETEESYTSKCDALALEAVGKHEEYVGRRVKRGLFQSSTGRLVNSDVNGAINIMRKVVGDSEAVLRIIGRGLVFRPVKMTCLF